MFLPSAVKKVWSDLNKVLKLKSLKFSIVYNLVPKFWVWMDFEVSCYCFGMLCNFVDLVQLKKNNLDMPEGMKMSDLKASKMQRVQTSR